MDRYALETGVIDFNLICSVFEIIATRQSCTNRIETTSSVFIIALEKKRPEISRIFSQIEVLGRSRGAMTKSILVFPIKYALKHPKFTFIT